MKIWIIIFSLVFFFASCRKDNAQTSQPVETNNTLDPTTQAKILKFISFLYGTDESNIVFEADAKRYFLKNEAIYINQSTILELYATANEYRLNHE